MWCWHGPILSADAVRWFVCVWRGALGRMARALAFAIGCYGRWQWMGVADAAADLCILAALVLPVCRHLMSR